MAGTGSGGEAGGGGGGGVNVGNSVGGLASVCVTGGEIADEGEAGGVGGGKRLRPAQAASVRQIPNARYINTGLFLDN